MFGYTYLIGDPAIREKMQIKRERVQDVAGKIAVGLGIAVIGFVLVACGYLWGLTCFYYG